MRILYLSQYFPPEVGATQTRAYEMARGLVRAGHHVTMIAEVPNHPSGVIPPAYRRKFYDRTDLDGIDVIRVWVKTSPVKTPRSRVIFYVSYMFMAVLTGLFLVRARYDVIYATSPPLFVGAAALIISYMRRIPLVFEVRDLWPESAVALGELSNPHVIRWAYWLEGVCYRRARKTVVTAQEMVEYLLRRGLEATKIAVIRNGANTELFRFDPFARQHLRNVLGLEDNFVVVYAGLLGIAQGLGASLEAAKQLATTEPRVHFLYIGDGPVKGVLQEQAEDLGLANVTFLPAQPRDAIPGYLSAGDVALVTLTRKRLLGALPSKMFDAMACQRPVLLGAEGEACQVLYEADAGIVVPPERPSALAAAVLRLRDDPELCARYGQNGRRAVVACYSREAQAQQLVQLLQEVVGVVQGDDATPS
jgi:colanic acid biosynthesis glycosyl transferase WcaI